MFSVDREEDQPELVSVVLPVSETVHATWQERTNDVQLEIASYVVGALYAVAKQRGAENAQVAAGGHEGLLALELELPSSSRDDLESLVASQIQRALEQAHETAQARVGVGATVVPVDYLLPPPEIADVEAEELA